MYEKEELFAKEKSFIIFFKDTDDLPRYKRIYEEGQVILDFARDNMSLDSLLGRAAEFEAPDSFINELRSFINLGIIYVCEDKRLVCQTR